MAIGRKIEVEILGKSQSAEKAFKDAGDASDGFGKKLKGVGSGLMDVGKIAGGVLLGGALAQGPGLLIGMAKAAAEDEQATMRLGQALKNAGGDFDSHLGKVNAAIDSGQKLAFTDDDVRDSFQTLLAATGDVDEALRRQSLAMDLARGAGIPLEKASLMLGKVTAENVEVFKRMGITIGEGASEAEAFAAVQAKFGGQADAYAKSTAGQFEVASIKMAEAKEQIGAALLPAMAGLATFLSDTVIPAIERFANWWGEVVQPKIEEFVAWVQPKLVEFGGYVAAEFAKFQVYYEENIKPALDNIQTAMEAVIGWIRDHWPEIEAIIRPVLEEVQNIVETVFGVVREVFQIVIDLLGGDFSGAWRNFKELIQVVMDGILESVTNRIELIKAVMAGAWAAIQEVIPAAWELIKSAVAAGMIKLKETITGFLSDLPGIFRQAAWDIGNAFADGLQAMAGWVYQKAKDMGSAAFDGVKAGAGALWPGSPSKAALAMGQAFADGLLAKRAAVEAAAKALAKAAQVPGLVDSAGVSWSTGVPRSVPIGTEHRGDGRITPDPTIDGLDADEQRLENLMGSGAGVTPAIAAAYQKYRRGQLSAAQVLAMFGGGQSQAAGGQHRTEGGSGNVGRSANPQPGGGGGGVVNLTVNVNGVVASDLRKASQQLVQHMIVEIDRVLGKQWRVA